MAKITVTKPKYAPLFGGYSDWTRQAMDDFADYYEQMQKVTDTPIYLTPGRGKLHFSEEDMRRYAEDVAVRLEYLVRKRNVKHLAYYCFSNELSQLTNGALQNRVPAPQAAPGPAGHRRGHGLELHRLGHGAYGPHHLRLLRPLVRTGRRL